MISILSEYTPLHRTARALNPVVSRGRRLAPNSVGRGAEAREERGEASHESEARPTVEPKTRVTNLISGIQYSGESKTC